MEDDEEAEKLSTEWIEEVNLKVLTRLASFQTGIDHLHILSKALFELQHELLKSTSKETGSKDTTGKRGREKKTELKLLMYLQDMQPMSTAKMVEPHNGKRLEAAVGEIDVILADITRYLPCKKVQTIAFRYVGKFIENLHKAFLIRSQEYSEVENELRKAESIGSQNADCNLAIELKRLQEHSSALKTQAELAEYHYKEVSSKNQDLEKTIKCLRSKIEQLQNGGKVTSEEIPPPADLLVEKKQANKISQSVALVKTSKQKLILAENLKVKGPSNEEPKNILFGGQDRTAEQRVVSGKNIPFGKPEEQKIAPEVCKKKTPPFGKSTRESISTKLSIGRITPTRSPKLEMILNEAVKRKMTKSNLNSGKKQRAWVQKEEALKTKAQLMVVDLLTDFQTAVLYSLDHGLHSGKDLAPDDIGKVQALLKSELKNLYGVIENMIKEISMQKLKQEPIEQPVQDRKPLEENLAEKSKEQQPDLIVFAELIEEISRFGIIQEIALDELSAQVQYFIEETKQDQSLSQEEMHFHEKTLQALDTILALQKRSSRAGMDQLIRIQEVISNLYSSNSALELYRKEVNLQTEYSKNEGIYLPVTPSAITGRTIQPRGEDLQVAEDKKIVEISYTVNVAYLRTTCKILDQAEYDGIISKQLNTIATHLIYKTLTTIQLRLAYLFRKYFAFHRIQIFR
ncbi:uncharacterized protein LOC132384994 [Hypanus sabinus]|uniref:uncharacterized protein LOC132384994 n=1 Tax=Hypanus sabinus TaxID=79690 RepID=UPI0028C44261|nr:uncharacterized protein LOC132384994 [Hypanus sabinus]